MYRKDSRRPKGSIYNNNGYWYINVRLPGETKAKNRPLRAPGSDRAMRADRPREMAIAAAHRLWEEAVRQEKKGPRGRTVDEICAAFLRHCQVYYRGGSEASNCASACRYIRELHGQRPAVELVHTDMLAVRDALVRHGYARTTVNRYMRIYTNRLFPWAFDEGLINAATKAELSQVMPLKRNRSEARETVPVRPVTDEAVRRTADVMMPNSADMVRVHRLTGMRPGELCAMRWQDIDTSCEPWVYRPAHHKNEWRGRPRAVLIGPRAREILERHRDSGDYPFSPVKAVEEWFAAKRAARTSPFYPCRDENYSRKDPASPRVIHDHWRPDGYCRTVQYACANAGVDPWSPNQLRHAFATEVRRKFGLEACRAVLGHTTGGGVTDRYSVEALEEELIRSAAPAVEALG